MKIDQLNKELKKHPMYVAFLQQALDSYCDSVLKDENETRKYLEKSFIDPESWIDIAKDFRKLTHD